VYFIELFAKNLLNIDKSQYFSDEWTRCTEYHFYELLT